MNTAAFAVFLVFIAITLGITAWASRRVKSRAEFYAAGSSISGTQNGLALAGDFLSAAAFLGVAGLYFGSGYDGFAYGISAIVGWPVLLYILAERMRTLGRYTLTDVLAVRLRNKPIRIYAACATLSILVFYMIAQMVGAGLLVNLLLGLDFIWAALLVGALMIIYVVFGGMVATTWVQIIKASLLVLAVILMAVLVLKRFDFSLNALFEAAIANHPQGAKIMGPIGLIDGIGTAVSLALTQVFGPPGLPHVLMRFFTVPDVKQARKSAFVATTIIGFFSFLMIIVGYGTIALLTNDPTYMVNGQMKGGGNMAALNLAHALGGDLLLGVIAAVAFCTILAVVSGLTLAAAAAVSHDLYTALRETPVTEKEEIRISRIGAFLFGAVCIGLSVIFQHMNVNILATFAMSVAASATFPVLILALFWKPLTTAGAVIGGSAGLIAAVVALVTGPGIWTAVLHFDAPIFPYQFPTILSLPLALITAVIVSLARPEKIKASA